MPDIPLIVDDDADVEPEISDEPIIITLYDGGMPYEVFEQIMDEVQNHPDANITIIYVSLQFML